MVSFRIAFLSMLAVLAPAACALRTSVTQTLVGGFIPSEDPARTGSFMFGRGLGLASLRSDVLAVGEAGSWGRGRVHMYTRNATGWALNATLYAPGNTAYQDRFGISLAISEDARVLAVGAPRDGSGDGAAATQLGAVYVFVSSAPSNYSFTHLQTLFVPVRMNVDKFGSIVQMSRSGHRIFAYSHAVRCSQGCSSTYANFGNRGVHVFSFNSTTRLFSDYARVQTPEPADTFFQQSGQPFGFSPESADSLWVLGFDTGYMNATKVTRTLVHRYSRSAAGNWTYLGALRAPSLAISQQLFGAAIVVTGDGPSDEAFVSAPRNDSRVLRYASGAATPGIVMPTQQFALGNDAVFDTSDSSDCGAHVTPWRTDTNFFGIALALSPSKRLLAVGAPFGIDAEIGNGRVYLYRRYTTADPWELVETFRSQWQYAFRAASYDRFYERGVIDEFGLDLALSDTTLVVGAKGASLVAIYDDLARYLELPSPSPPPPPVAPPPPISTRTEEIVLRGARTVAVPLFVSLLLLLLLLLVALLVSRWAVRKVIKRRIMRRKMLAAIADSQGDADVANLFADQFGAGVSIEGQPNNPAGSAPPAGNTEAVLFF